MVSLAHVPTGQFIIACWATFLLFWLVNAFRVKKTKTSESWFGLSFLSRLVLAVGILLAFEIKGVWFTGRGLWPYSTTIGVVADCICAFGLAILLWARVTLGRNWSAGVVWKEGHELIRGGPYAHVRHPIYSGILLLFLGEAVWFGSIGWFLLFAAFGYVLWRKSQQEERLMEHHFPNAYQDYKRTTKALVPFVF